MCAQPGRCETYVSKISGPLLDRILEVARMAVD